MDDLIQVTDRGLYCPKGEFYIDPWRPTDLALITHAHADHARQGAHRYLATRASEPILCHRLGASINLDPVNYGDRFKLGKTWVSFHPAGHVLGSAQIRVEHKDEVWVVSGDYKRASDPTCSPFEVVPCTTFISEATFALPVYRWQAPAEVAQQIYTWWQADLSRPSLLFCYAFGKAQRVLAELMRFTNRPVYLHGAVTRLTQLYREQGVQMLPT
ncbi:MAG: DNA ligase-associated DEXH box helicase, partial [Deinococcota bacterium]